MVGSCGDQCTANFMEEASRKQSLLEGLAVFGADRPPDRLRLFDFCVCYCCIPMPTEGLIIVISKAPREGIDGLPAFKPAGPETGDRHAGWL